MSRHRADTTALAPPGSPGAQLRALREAYGWSLQQVGQATHYCKSMIWEFEHGLQPLPADVAAWLRAIPWPRRVHYYPPTPGGLRMYVRRTRIRVVELAAFAGVSESTVYHWLRGSHPLSRPIKAWLAAGAPVTWTWGPPGAEIPRCRPYRPFGDRPTRTRPELGGRRGSATLLRRWEAQAKARPWRRKPAAAAPAPPQAPPPRRVAAAAAAQRQAGWHSVQEEAPAIVPGRPVRFEDLPPCPASERGGPRYVQARTRSPQPCAGCGTTIPAGQPSAMDRKRKWGRPPRRWCPPCWDAAGLVQELR